MPYKDRLDKLSFSSLKERRNSADLIEVFKMVKVLSASPWSHFFQKAGDTLMQRRTQLEICEVSLLQ